MKKILLLIIGLLFSLPIRSAGDITIGLVMPEEEIEGIKPDAFSLLQSKLENMLSSAGVSATGGDFVMYPTINIIEEKMVEGGIKNFFVVNLELTLNIANLSTKTVFASQSWPLSGSSERVKSTAVKQSFSQLKSSDSNFKSFIEKAKDRIVNYYESNKGDILAKAERLSASGEHEEAMAMLSTYPMQVNGYNEAQSMLAKVYSRYINKNAATILNEARAAYASKNYEEAVNLAARIDPESAHYKDARSLINNVRTTIDNENAAAHKRTMKALEIAADVQKTRINAAASVARAYYKRRVVNYHTIRIYR